RRRRRAHNSAIAALDFIHDSVDFNPVLMSPRHRDDVKTLVSYGEPEFKAIYALDARLDGGFPYFCSVLTRPRAEDGQQASLALEQQLDLPAYLGADVRTSTPRRSVELRYFVRKLRLVDFNRSR